MKLSELTYEFLQSIGLQKCCIPAEATDSLRSIDRPIALEWCKEYLFEKYGDVNLVITPEAEWYAQVKIDDEKWQADHDRYEQEKYEFCRKYGCN